MGSTRSCKATAKIRVGTNILPIRNYGAGAIGPYGTQLETGDPNGQHHCAHEKTDLKKPKPSLFERRWNIEV